MERPRDDQDPQIFRGLPAPISRVIIVGRPAADDRPRQVFSAESEEIKRKMKSKKSKREVSTELQRLQRRAAKQLEVINEETKWGWRLQLDPNANGGRGGFPPTTTPFGRTKLSFVAKGVRPTVERPHNPSSDGSGLSIEATHCAMSPSRASTPALRRTESQGREEELMRYKLHGGDIETHGKDESAVEGSHNGSREIGDRGVAERKEMRWEHVDDWRRGFTVGERFQGCGGPADPATAAAPHPHPPAAAAAGHAAAEHHVEATERGGEGHSPLPMDVFVRRSTSSTLGERGEEVASMSSCALPPPPPPPTATPPLPPRASSSASSVMSSTIFGGSLSMRGATSSTGSRSNNRPLMLAVNPITFDLGGDQAKDNGSHYAGSAGGFRLATDQEVGKGMGKSSKKKLVIGSPGSFRSWGGQELSPLPSFSEPVEADGAARNHQERGSMQARLGGGARGGIRDDDDHGHDRDHHHVDCDDDDDDDDDDGHSSFQGSISTYTETGTSHTGTSETATDRSGAGGVGLGRRSHRPQSATLLDRYSRSPGRQHLQHRISGHQHHVLERERGWVPSANNTNQRIAAIPPPSRVRPSSAMARLHRDKGETQNRPATANDPMLRCSDIDKTATAEVSKEDAHSIPTTPDFTRSRPASSMSTGSVARGVTLPQSRPRNDNIIRARARPATVTSVGPSGYKPNVAGKRVAIARAEMLRGSALAAGNGWAGTTT